MTEPRIASITRYPVKGLPGVVATGDVALAPGRGLRWDRSHAIENGRVPVEDPAAYHERDIYFHVARNEGIARFGVALDDAESDAATITLTAPDGTTARSVLTSAAEPASAVAGLLRSALPAGPVGPAHLVRTVAPGLWDWEHAYLSFINLATVAALAEAAGAPVDPRRFRGNLLLEGIAAWGELALIGRRFRIGGAVVEFFQPTDRCRATTIDPDRGVSDLNVPGLLASRFGHMYCGVYARVVAPGAVRAGDPLEPLDEAAGPMHGEADWPRTGTVVDREPAGARSESFWIADPRGLLGEARPGQHLRVHLAGEQAPAWRSYTISGTAPGRARVTVRRDGRISSAMHDAFSVGTEVIVTGPFGDVTLDPAGTDGAGGVIDADGTVTARDVVLVSAGSGITPTVAMLSSLAAAGSRRRVRVLHVERAAADLALWDEVTAACATLPDATATLHLSRATADDPADASLGARTGRPSSDDVLDLLNGLDPSDTDVFVCGPALFTAEMRAATEGAGVPSDRVHAEVFYSPTAAELTDPREPSTPGPHRIVAGVREIRWTADSGSILDAVEGAGQDWPSGCRAGACGTCVRRLVSGDVEYLIDPIVPPPAGSVLVCCSAPTSDVELDAP